MQQKNTTPVSFVGKHTFTQEEKDAKLQQMLAAMRQKDEIEDEFKTTKSNYKSKIDAKTAEIKLVGNLLNAGFEDRTFTCTLVKNFDEGRREYFEIGSNRLVGTEPLTASDYQTQLQIDEDAIKANNEAADKLAEIQEEAPADLFKPATDEDAAVEQNEWQPEFDKSDNNPKLANNKHESIEPKGGINEEDPPLENIEIDPFGTDDESEDGDPFDFSDFN